jgi:hypothetical protein
MHRAAAGWPAQVAVEARLARERAATVLQPPVLTQPLAHLRTTWSQSIADDSGVKVIKNRVKDRIWQIQQRRALLVGGSGRRRFHVRKPAAKGSLCLLRRFNLRISFPWPSGLAATLRRHIGSCAIVLRWRGIAAATATPSAQKEAAKVVSFHPHVARGPTNCNNTTASSTIFYIAGLGVPTPPKLVTPFYTLRY